jgi:hypothetical protein
LYAFIFVTVSYLSIGLPIVIGATAGSWTQTSQADWQSDTLNNLDVSSSPGYVKIASGGELAIMGELAINRTVFCCSGAANTVINISPGTAAPVSGQIFAYQFYARDTSGVLELKIFRDNSTYYSLVGQGPRVPMIQGFNYDTLSIPIGVQRGDLLGFYWTGDLTWSPGNVGGEVYTSGTDVNGTTSHSTWTQCCAPFYSLLYSVQAEIRPFVTGSLLSTVKDTGGTSTWSTINWTAAVPQGTSLSLNTRSSNDSITWSQWSANYTSSGAPIKSSTGRYIQYQALFSASGNSTQTPTLHSVTLSYSTSPLSSTSSSSFLSTYLPWIILAAVVVGFVAAVFLTKPKTPKTG